MKPSSPHLPLLALLCSGCFDQVAHNKSPELYAGATPAGVFIAGEAVAGEAVAGEAVAGEAVAGEAVAGTPVAGTPVAGTPVAGTPVAGTPIAGTPVAGTPVAGEPIAGQMTTEGFLEALSGGWRACVDGEGRSQLKRYRFEPSSAGGGEWSYSEARYAELGCVGDSSMTLRESGSFTVGVPDEAAQELYPLDLALSARTLSADRASASALLGDLCGLSFPVGEPVDLTEQGCARLSFAPRGVCPVRYELVELSAGALRLGDAGGAVCVEAERARGVGGGYERG
jgi:hypothetical protein